MTDRRGGVRVDVVGRRTWGMDKAAEDLRRKGRELGAWRQLAGGSLASLVAGLAEVRARVSA